MIVVNDSSIGNACNDSTMIVELFNMIVSCVDDGQLIVNVSYPIMIVHLYNDNDNDKHILSDSIVDTW